MTTTIDQYLYYIDESYMIEEFKKIELLTEKISFNKITAATKSNLLKIESIVSQYTSVSKIKSSAKSVAGKYKSKMMKLHKQGVAPKKAGIEISKEIGKDLKKVLLKAKGDLQEASVGIKIIVTLAMLVVLLFFNTLLITIVAQLFSDPKTVVFIVATIIAPLTEETLKLYFIKKGMPWIGTGIVFGLEALSYIMKMILMGLNIPKVLIMRAATLLMHFATTAIQKTFVEEDEVFMGWIIACTIHMLWNGFSIAYSDDILAWAN